MLGLVFTTFLDLLDEQYGLMVTEEIIARCDLASGGAYTAVGDYPSRELVQLAEALRELQDVPLPETFQALGERLVLRSRATHPTAFEEAASLFEFLEQLEERLHIELLKLQDDAPSLGLRTERRLDGTLELAFPAHPPMEYLALGAVATCAHLYNTQVQTELIRNPASNEVGLLISPWTTDG